jgi:hypothetical protein
MIPFARFAGIPLPYLCLLLLMVLAVGGLLVWRRFRSGVWPDPRCGGCGYIVRGISSLTCPECGGDLREVGIIPAGTRRPIGRLTWVAIWSTILIPLAVILSAVLQYAAGPVVYKLTTQQTISYYVGSSRDMLQAELAGQSILWGSHWPVVTVPPQTLTLTLARGGTMSTVRLTVDLGSRGYRYNTVTGIVEGKPSGFNARVLAHWIAANSGAEDSAALKVAHGILSIVSLMPGNQGKLVGLFEPPDGLAHVFTSLASSATYPVWKWWNWAIWIALWLLVWLEGCRRILRSVRRRPVRTQPFIAAD